MGGRGIAGDPGLKGEAGNQGIRGDAGGPGPAGPTGSVGADGNENNHWRVPQVLLACFPEITILPIENK